LRKPPSANRSLVRRSGWQRVDSRKSRGSRVLPSGRRRRIQVLRSQARSRRVSGPPSASPFSAAAALPCAAGRTRRPAEPDRRRCRPTELRLSAVAPHHRGRGLAQLPRRRCRAAELCLSPSQLTPAAASPPSWLDMLVLKPMRKGTEEHTVCCSRVLKTVRKGTEEHGSSEAKHQHGHLAATVCCSRNYWKPNSGSSEVCQAIFYAMCMLLS